ncbi:hypothetical protein ScPMuIL_000259 [Solemya velum]
MATCVLKRALAQCFHLQVIAKCNTHLPSRGVIRCLSTSRASLSKLYFTDKHEYINVDKKGDNYFGKVGISDYAQSYLTLGAEVEQEVEAGVLESVKAASEVYCPASGEVTEINEQLSDEPKLINESWLEKGWLFKMKITQPDELKSLMDEDGYKKFLEESD